MSLFHTRGTGWRTWSSPVARSEAIAVRMSVGLYCIRGRIHRSATAYWVKRGGHRTVFFEERDVDRERWLDIVAEVATAAVEGW